MGSSECHVTEKYRNVYGRIDNFSRYPLMPQYDSLKLPKNIFSVKIR